MTAAPGVSTANPAETSAPPDPRRWWALVAIGIGELMIVLDIRTVNIALSSF